MDEKQMLKIVEQYDRQNVSVVDEIKVTRIPNGNTIYIEKNEEQSRSIILTEYKVDGKTYWAGYSSRSHTVYVSLSTYA